MVYFRKPWIWCLFVLVILAPTRSLAGELQARDVVLAAIEGERFYTLVPEINQQLQISQHLYRLFRVNPLTRETRRGAILSFADNSPRWHLAFDRVWKSSASRSQLTPSLVQDFTDFCPLTELLVKEEAVGESSKHGRFQEFIRPSGPLASFRSACQFMSESKFHIFYDCLPVSPMEALIFVLTDIKFDMVEVADKPDRERIHYDMPQPTTNRKWTLQVWKYNVPERGGVALVGIDRWRLEKWALLASLPGPFEEPFHVFGRKGSFFLVTRSGKAHHLTMGTARVRPRIAPIWADPKFPIRAVIDDVDQERTFAFGMFPVGQDHFCAELKWQPSLDRIRVSAADFEKADGRLSILTDYAAVIIAKKAPIK
jgi:hypothetical protein